MQRIAVYDEQAKEIESLTEELNITECELIEAILEALKDNDINIADYV